MNPVETKFKLNLMLFPNAHETLVNVCTFILICSTLVLFCAIPVEITTYSTYIY